MEEQTMNTNEVRIGAVYQLKVGRNVVDVRIDRASEKGGWEGTTCASGKSVVIRDANRLLGQAPAQEKPKKAFQKQQLSCLDAAEQVLREDGRPLNCSAMIEIMLSKGLWKSPGGKTPANTLYSAILREIAKKGTEARFAKVERGKFVIQS